MTTPVKRYHRGRRAIPIDHAAVRELVISGASVRHLEERLSVGHGTAQRAYEAARASLTKKELAARKKNIAAGLQLGT